MFLFLKFYQLILAITSFAAKRLIEFYSLLIIFGLKSCQEQKVNFIHY